MRIPTNAQKKIVINQSSTTGYASNIALNSSNPAQIDVTRTAMPTIGNGTFKIQGAGTDASSFTANSTSNVTLNIKGSGATSVTRSAANEITVSSADTHVTAVGNHYTPTGTTSKDASGGTLTDIANSANGTQVVTGVNIDAAGHVTGVKSVALKATNNTYTVSDGKLTIQKNGTDVASFTANQSSNTTANIAVPGINGVSSYSEGSGTNLTTCHMITVTTDNNGTKRRIAWGRTGDGKKDGYYRVNISFNAGFSAAPETVIVLPWGANDDAPSNGWKVNGTSGNITSSGCTIYMDAAWDTIRGVYWFAIGASP